MKKTLLITGIAFLVLAFFIRPSPKRIIIFPKDFVGRAVVVQDPSSDFDIPVNGWWNREAIVRIPESGILKVTDMTPLHWLTQEKVLLDDGTILDGTYPWTKRPSKFRYVEVPEDNSLGYRVSNKGQWDHVEFEVSKESIFIRRGEK
jgi:hypothetical protein